MRIPFVDLFAQYQSIKPEIDKAIAETIGNSAYIGGPAVSGFERSFASYLGINEVVSCANGTDSIEIILKAWGIGEGDEVIVPAHSWISTAEAVSSVGALPVFVDVEPDYFTIDPGLIERSITAKTKAIIPVHLFGHPADMMAIMDIARKFNLFVLEDCAQSHGASINGINTGTFGHAASFSFYPGKNLGAYGDAGCMATNDNEVATVLRCLANHGQKGKHNHEREGRNSRLDGLQAAILSAKLPFLPEWTAARIHVAALYEKYLKQKPEIKIPLVKSGYTHVFHLYVVKVENRPEIQKIMVDNGVDCAIHYPTALPFLPCYKSRNYSGPDFPIAYNNQSRILSLPMFPELKEESIQLICDLI